MKDKVEMDETNRSYDWRGVPGSVLSVDQVPFSPKPMAMSDSDQLLKLKIQIDEHVAEIGHLQSNIKLLRKELLASKASAEKNAFAVTTLEDMIKDLFETLARSLKD